MINKNYTLLFLASCVSTLGASMTYIALYWYYFEQTTVTSLTLLTTATFLAGFVFNLFLTPICDKYDPKQLMWTTMLIRCILLLSVGLAMYFFDISIYYMVTMMILLVALESIYDPSSIKIITRIVKEDEYVTANSWLSILDRMGFLIGMLLGGIIIAVIDMEMILLIEAVSFFIGFMLLSFLQETYKVNEEETEESDNYFILWKNGITYIFRTRWLLWIAVIAIAANLAITPTVTLLIPYTSEVLQGQSFHYSVLEVSSILGGILMAYLIGKFKMQKLFHWFIIAALLQSMCIISLSFNHSIGIAMVILFLLGTFISLFNVPFTTILQKYVPNSYLGRVRGGMIALSTGLSSVGYAFSGVISEKIGIVEAILCYGLLGMVIIGGLAMMKPFKDVTIN
ncbi:MAG: MFS transporter [Staphylococcus rostri]|uniref:MFS transporter n=1 Tax=Staphylococcus rostri TaxID=522262 RepID=UPI0026DF8BF9|nr:MFS transporter [Staphylococcus rostri]MDO5376098.1 MFS transporter [Staphylococcus rostri]